MERLEDRTVPSFAAPLSYEAGRFPSSVAVGDFNGDGKLDLAVANDGSDNVSVLLGNGDGSFQAARNYAAGAYPRSVAVGDFNGDGQHDLAVATRHFPSEHVSVLLGNGDGTFQTARSFAAGDGPQLRGGGGLQRRRRPRPGRRQLRAATT